ncbi:MAG: PKD domain-containing protein, partial [Planctomycetota bacterium]
MRTVRAEERKFVVTLAHSPKSFTDANGNPGLPPGGLDAVAPIRQAYFDIDPTNDVLSFAEYWEEISYGDVTVSGDVFGWVTLPWAFEPDPPNAAEERPSPVDFVDLHRGILPLIPAPIELVVPFPYAYGAGEEFCDVFPIGGSDTEVTTDKCGGLIIRDFRGTDDGQDPPVREAGLWDLPVVGVNVWTPGERFLDVDGDMRWDGLDEANDRFCYDPSSPNLPPFLRLLPTLVCPEDVKCLDGSTERPCGCAERGCGSLRMPWTDFDRNGQANNCSPTCLPGQDPLVNGCCAIPDDLESPTNCIPPNPVDGCGISLPQCCEEGQNPDQDNCEFGVEGIDCGDPILCCEFEDVDQDGQLTVPEPFEDFIIRWDPTGSTPSSVWTPVTEKYIRDNYPGDVEAVVRRSGVREDLRPEDCPLCGQDFDNDGLPDVNCNVIPPGVVCSGNGFYDPPDVFYDVGSTKMMQDAGPNRFVHFTPEPGTLRTQRPNTAFGTEESWYPQFWTDRYGEDSPPPPWPSTGGWNSPRMRPFDPEVPVPPTVVRPPDTGGGGGQQQVRIWFQPNRGGFDGLGNGTSEDPTAITFGDDLPFEVLPEEEFGFYDGWVEHDDLPSSKYHREGDKRLGEVTYPGSDDSPYLVDPADPQSGFLTAIWGRDLGPHTPQGIAGADGVVPAAGPYAVNIHGEKGFDAGDVCILEWLTWRTDGTSPTIAYQWEIDNATSRGAVPYHPYAGPKRCSRGDPDPNGVPCKEDADCPSGQTCQVWSLGKGFRDYNLDGMIDQGEVRPDRSENYIVDSNPFTTNDGTHTDYPFNRRRLMEDVVEALDFGVDWDDFIDPNAKAANECIRGASGTPVLTLDPTAPQDPGHQKVIEPQGFVSGIVIIPRGATNSRDAFPTAPFFYPIHNEDNQERAFMIPDWPAEGFDANGIHKSFNLRFHDLVICADCRTPAPAVVPYAAHEYLHSWEGFPDLYDYDVFGNGVDEVNCPIGAWDIMAGTGHGQASLVHPVPILKEKRCTEWISPIDLRTVLTPGVEATLTLPPSERVRNGYYFLENPERPGERYYFWSAGSTGFGVNLPGEGMLILHTNIDANEEGLPLQQRTAPFNYLIVQADGRGDLEACSSGGNDGDAGDPWPGSTGATRFNFFTNPPATWQSFNQWTGLDITDIQPDGTGSIALTLSLFPTQIPGLGFVQPPGGDSVDEVYQIRFSAIDLFGGTTIKFFAVPDVKRCDGTGAECVDHADCPSGQVCEHDTSLTSPNVILVGQRPKDSSGLNFTSFDWNLTGVPDGRYVLFAKLMPGVGVDNQREHSWTAPVPGRTNVGDGTVDVVDVAIDDDADDADDTARFETWTLVCIDDGQTWRVNSSLTQPVLDEENPDGDYPTAQTCPKGTADCSPFAYTSRRGAVTFIIREGDTPFSRGDQFTFSTTGITAVSAAVTVLAERISEDPRAKIVASPLSGRPPLTVNFDATESVDPNGEALNFSWNFGDGSPQATGAIVQHVYTEPGRFTVVLRATNPRTGRFGETAVDIEVINNLPAAVFTATPSSGPAPLTVQLDASDSTDQETPPEQLIYQWNFGDGETGNILGVPGVLRQTSHTYTSEPGTGRPCTADDPCTFTITLDVTDADGGTTTVTRSILVGNTRPVARVTVGPLTGPAPLSVRFNAISSTDEDGDTLRVRWDFDDPADPGIVEKPIEGDDGRTGVVTHIYTQPGTYHPSATILDGHPGGEDKWTIDTAIVVTPSVPGSSNPRAVFTIDPDPPVLGQPFVADASLSFDRPPGSRIASYTWDWGDGSPQESGVVATHTYTEPGEYTITLTVADGETPPNTDTATLIVRVGLEGSGQPGVPAEKAPVIALTVTPTIGTVGETEFVFDATASTDPDGDDSLLTFQWTFGDGDVAQGSLVRHVYQTEGRFVVEVRVTDADGLVAMQRREVEVRAVGANLPPVAIIATGLRTGTAPVVLTFDGRNSFDPDGDPLEYRWEFSLNGNLIDTMSGPLVQRLFDTAGIYQVVLVVTDTEG